MNAFERHGIDHLSASSLNAARSSLAYWLVHYRAKVRDPSNLSMLAGQVAEDAVSMALFDNTIPPEKCVELAKIDFLKGTTIGNYDPDDRQAKLEDIIGREAEGRKKAYPGFVRKAITALRPYGPPTVPEQGSKQHRIEIMLEGIPVPVIGFKDFAFDKLGLDVDLKTTGRMPEDMSQEHQLQAAIYRKASGNRAQRFCYVTKADAKVLELTAEAGELQIAAATRIAHTLMRFLSLSNDWRELVAITIPDYSNFRWGKNTREFARGIFGF